MYENKHKQNVNDLLQVCKSEFKNLCVDYREVTNPHILEEFMPRVGKIRDSSLLLLLVLNEHALSNTRILINNPIQTHLFSNDIPMHFD